MRPYRSLWCSRQQRLQQSLPAAVNDDRLNIVKIARHIAVDVNELRVRELSCNVDSFRCQIVPYAVDRVCTGFSHGSDLLAVFRLVERLDDLRLDIILFCQLNKTCIAKLEERVTLRDRNDHRGHRAGRLRFFLCGRFLGSVFLRSRFLCGSFLLGRFLCGGFLRCACGQAEYHDSGQYRCHQFFDILFHFSLLLSLIKFITAASPTTPLRAPRPKIARPAAAFANLPAFCTSQPWERP